MNALRVQRRAGRTARGALGVLQRALAVVMRVGGGP